MSRNHERPISLKNISVNAAIVIACGAAAVGVEQLGIKKHAQKQPIATETSTSSFNKIVLPEAPGFPGVKPVVDVKGSYLYPGTPVKNFQQLNLAAVAKEVNSQIIDNETGPNACNGPRGEIATPIYTDVDGKNYLVDAGYSDRHKKGLELGGIAIANLPMNTSTVDNLFFAFYDHHKYDLTAIVSGREPHSDYYDNAYLNIPAGIPTPSFINCVPHTDK